MSENIDRISQDVKALLAECEEGKPLPPNLAPRIENVNRRLERYISEYAPPLPPRCQR